MVCANGKIAEILPEDRRAEAQGNHLAVSDWGVHPPKTIDMAVLRAALRENRALKITYLDESGTTTERTILPVALVYYVQVAVLAAWCRLRQDYRHFRIDRIQRMDLAPEFFTGEALQLRRNWEIARQKTEPRP